MHNSARQGRDSNAQICNSRRAVSRDTNTVGNDDKVHRPFSNTRIRRGRLGQTPIRRKEREGRPSSNTKDIGLVEPPAVRVLVVVYNEVCKGVS